MNKWLQLFAAPFAVVLIFASWVWVMFGWFVIPVFAFHYFPLGGWEVFAALLMWWLIASVVLHFMEPL